MRAAGQTRSPGPAGRMHRAWHLPEPEWQYRAPTPALALAVGTTDDRRLHLRHAGKHTSLDQTQETPTPGGPGLCNTFTITRRARPAIRPTERLVRNGPARIGLWPRRSSASF